MAYQIEKQFSLFDPLPEPEDSSGFTQEEIDKCLGRGSGYSRGKLRIYRQFKKEESAAQNIAFLKSEYGIGGCAPAFSSKDRSREVNMDYNSNGVTLWCFESKDRLFLPWSKVEKRIKKLIDLGAYINPKHPCLTCIFEQDGRCQHIESKEPDEWWCCRLGSFRISKDITCSKCGRRIKLKDIQQADFGSDAYNCPKCGQVTIFANRGDRPTAMQLWEKGKLIGK